MKLSFIQHAQHNWPLALIAAGLLVYMPIVLISGVFYTNQGPITRSNDPILYWRWVLRFFAILLVSVAVLVGSYMLDPTH